MKTFTARIPSYFLLSLMLVATTAIADQRVALVNVGKLLNDSSEAHDKRGDLDARAKKTREKLEGEREDIQALDKKLRDSGAADTSKEVLALRSRARDFDRAVHDSEEELRGEYLKVNRGLSDKLIKAVNAIAKEKNLNLILDKGEVGRSAVLFGDDTLDITDLVQAKMDE